MHKMGILGFGGMANYHFDNLNDYSRVDVKGVYDTDPKKLEFAKEKGLIAYDSKEVLLADSEIDIVLVATPNDVHKTLCIDALSSGKHVLCEKPVTVCSKDLAEIIEASKKYNKVFTINQNRRTNWDFVLMRRKVEEGLIGKPYYIESRVEGSRGLRGWRTKKAQGGGMLLDWGVHLIDQLLYMIDEPVTSIFCKTTSIKYPEVDDSFRLILTFKSGLVAQIEASSNNYITHPRWYVLGENGTLQIDSWDCTGKIVRSGSTNDDTLPEKILNTKAGPTKTMAPRSEFDTETITLTEPTDVNNSITVVYDQFCDAIDGKSELTIKPEEAMRVVKIMETAFRSADTEECIHTEI